MAYYSGGDEYNGIVMEFGSYSTKIGYAGDDYPNSLFRSTSAIRNDGSSRRRCFDYMTRMLPEEEKWKLENPIPRWSGGCLLDMEVISEYILHHNTTTEMMNNNNEQQQLPVLFIERSYHPPQVRQQLLELLLETNNPNIPAAFLARDAVCACYAVGRTTGTVVDMGHSQTTVSPVYEGYVEQSGIQISPVGSMHVNQSILSHLGGINAKPYYQTILPTTTVIRPFHKMAQLDMASQCKESGAGVIVRPFSATTEEQTNTTTIPPHPYTLPDGTVVSLNSHQRSEPIESCYFANHSKYRTDEFNKYQKKLESSLLSLHTTTTTTTQQPSSSSLLQSNNNNNNNNTSTSKPDMMEYLHGNLSTISSTGLRKTTKNQNTNTNTFTTNASSSRCKEEQNHNNNNNSNQKKKKLTQVQELKKASMTYFSSILPDQQLSEASLPQMVCDSAFSCERDYQPQLLGSMMVVGGGSCIPNMEERLKSEVEHLIHQHTPGWRVKTLSPPNPNIANWLGGSILGSLSSFSDMYITKQQYNEYGSNIVHRKCP